MGERKLHSVSCLRFGFKTQNRYRAIIERESVGTELESFSFPVATKALHEHHLEILEA